MLPGEKTPQVKNTVFYILIYHRFYPAFKKIFTKLLPFYHCIPEILC